MATYNDGSQSDVSLGEIWTSLKNNGTSAITPGSTNGTNLSMGDLMPMKNGYSISPFSYGGYFRNTNEKTGEYTATTYANATGTDFYIGYGKHMGRLKSGSGTNISVTNDVLNYPVLGSNANPTSGGVDISLNSYRGVSDSWLLAHDNCGQTLSADTYRVWQYNFSPQASVEVGNKFKFFGLPTSTNSVAAVVKPVCASNTTHTFNLGTVCAAGDTVIVLSGYGGGNNRSPVTYSSHRAKLLNQSGSVTVTAGSGVTDQIYYTKYEGGSGYSDTYGCCQRLVATGGENQVRLFTLHSNSSYNCIICAIVIKGTRSIQGATTGSTENSFTTWNTGTANTGGVGAPKGYILLNLANYPGYVSGTPTYTSGGSHDLWTQNGTYVNSTKGSWSGGFNQLENHYDQTFDAKSGQFAYTFSGGGPGLYANTSYLPSYNGGGMSHRITIF